MINSRAPIERGRRLARDAELGAPWKRFIEMTTCYPPQGLVAPVPFRATVLRLSPNGCY